MIRHLKHFERSWKRWLARSLDRRNSLKRVALIAGSVMLMGCQEQILHDLTEYEANKVVGRLSESDISPSKVLQADGRWAVSVSKQKVVKALAVVDSSRILATRLNAPTASTKSGLIPNRHEQWYLYVQSIAQSLEQSLRAIPGVLEARVHLNMPESDPLIGKSRDQVGSGSVLLLISRDFETKDEEIAALVSGAAGMPSSSIRVLRSLAIDAREKGDEKLPPLTAEVSKSEISVAPDSVITGQAQTVNSGGAAIAQTSGSAEAADPVAPSREGITISREVVTAACAGFVLLLCLAGVVLFMVRRRSRGAHFPIERGAN